MRKHWGFAFAALAAAPLFQPAMAQSQPDRINGRVQAINADQLVLVTENGTTYIKMTPQAVVSLVKAGQADNEPAGDGAAADGAPGKISDVELGSTVSVSVTRTSDGLPVASRIAVETGG